MASTLIPVAPADGSHPPVAAYHPTAVDPDLCQALRYSALTKDRRWSPMVYAAFQCTKMPVRDSDLCERCLKQAQKYDEAVAAGAPTSRLRDIDWSGRVGDLASIPAHSHIAGSQWHTDGMVSGAIRWTGMEKPKTTKQEGLLKRRPAVSDADMTRFADGKIEMDIERLAGPANQITAKQLRDVIGRLERRVVSASEFRTKAEMCARIRVLKDPAYDPVAEAAAAVAAVAAAKEAAKAEKAAAAAAAKEAKRAARAAAKEAAKAEKAAAKEAAKAAEKRLRTLIPLIRKFITSTPGTATRQKAFAALKAAGCTPTEYHSVRAAIMSA